MSNTVTPHLFTRYMKMTKNSLNPTIVQNPAVPASIGSAILYILHQDIDTVKVFCLSLGHPSLNFVNQYTT